MVRILVVDDHAVVRAGMRHFVDGVSSMEVAGRAATADSAIQLTRTEEYGVVLLDISMPNKSGIEILTQLKQDEPQLPVLILSMHPENRYAVQLLRNGASGYVQKEALATDLVNAIQTVVLGRKYISPAVAELLTASTSEDSDRPLHDYLSKREFDVFMRLANGQGMTLIAEDMELSVKTISTYRNRVLEKMKLASNADLIYYAIKQNLVA